MQIYSCSLSPSLYLAFAIFPTIVLLGYYSLSNSLLSPALFHCLVVTFSALLYHFLFYLHICPFLHPSLQHTALIFLFLLPYHCISVLLTDTPHVALDVCAVLHVK